MRRLMRGHGLRGNRAKHSAGMAGNSDRPKSEISADRRRFIPTNEVHNMAGDAEMQPAESASSLSELGGFIDKSEEVENEESEQEESPEVEESE